MITNKKERLKEARANKKEAKDKARIMKSIPEEVVVETSLRLEYQLARGKGYKGFDNFARGLVADAVQLIESLGGKVAWGEVVSAPRKRSKK